MKILAILLLFVALVFSQNIRTDTYTGAGIVIDYEHHEVHGGSHFTFSASAVVGDADTLGYLIVTPNTTKWAHLVYSITGALDTEAKLFETSTHTVSDTQTVWNNNRNSSTTNTTLIKGVTRVEGNDGTAIDSSRFGIDAGFGAGRVANGGAARGAQEWVLKQNTAYYICIISNTASNVVNLKLSWYEHTDRGF